MARIFLSYGRGDAAKAQAMAHALEHSGHAVWWDFNIKGGTEYSKEIEQALEAADAVVVLWSQESIDSAWVRDEAALGRDRGRLVPICLDGTNPPMGFRQYQSIDMSSWKGRGAPHKLKDILSSIDALTGEQTERSVRSQMTVVPSGWERPGFTSLMVFAVVLILSIAAIIFLVNRNSKPPVPVVAVVTADKNPATRSLADDLFIKLGSLQSANTEALQLIEQNSNAKPDLSFRVAQRTVDGQAQATVALLTGGGGLLWSREFAQQKRPMADLQQQIAYSSALVLACATDAMSPGHKELGNITLKLYLSGCSRFSDEFGEDPRSLVEIFDKVTQQAPDFEGGWAKLLIAETRSFLESGLSTGPLRESLAKHVQQARRVNPTMAEAYVAQSWMQPIWNINGWMPISEAAVRKNPFNVFALTEHANDMLWVGRVQQGVSYAQAAVEADPLSPWVRDALIVALVNAGEIEAAKDALKEAERLWPGASNLVQTRFYLTARNGDPREALAMLKSGKVSRIYMSTAMDSFLEARIDPSPANVDRAVAQARSVSDRWLLQYMETLAAFRRKEELIKALMGYDPGDNLGPAQVFQPKYGFLQDDVRFMAIMAKWGSQLDYWRKSGNWPDFCFRPGLPYDCKAEAARLAKVKR